MVNDAPAKASWWQRNKGWILFVSLALNVFLASIAAGWGYHHYYDRGMHGTRGGGPLAFRQAVESLPEPERAVFRDIMAARRAQMDPARQDLRQARQRVNEAVRAEPFDAASLAAALADSRARSQAMMAQIHASIVEAVSKLSPEARKTLAEEMQKRGRFRP